MNLLEELICSIKALLIIHILIEQSMMNKKLDFLFSGDIFFVAPESVKGGLLIAKITEIVLYSGKLEQVKKKKCGSEIEALNKSVNGFFKEILKTRIILEKNLAQ